MAGQMPLSPLVLDAQAPYEIAGEFVSRRYQREGTRTLYHHIGEFYAWTGTPYAVSDDDSLRAEMYEFLDNAIKCSAGYYVPFKPKRTHVNDVVDALKALVHLDFSCTPAWLGQAPVPAHEIVPCKNGLLHLPTRQPHAGILFAESTELRL